MAISIELIPFGSGDSLTINDEAIISLRGTKRYNGIGDFSVTLRGDRRLEDRAKRQDRLNLKVDGTTEFAGILTACSQNKRTGNTTITGKGIAKRLLEGRPDYDTIGGPLTYQNEFVEDVLRDYWPRTPFGNVTVTDQPQNIVVEDAEQQSADTQSEWESVLDIPATTPLYIENGSLKLAQTGFVDDISGTVSRIDFSGGSGEPLTAAGTSIISNFTTEYESSDFQVSVRSEEIEQDQISTLQIYVDGTNVGEVAPDTLGWYSTSVGSTLSAGSHTVEVEATDSGGLSFGRVEIDVVAVTDTTYSFTFDNTVHQDNGYLDGPELYGGTATTTTNTVDTTRTIASTTVNATLNNISEDQRLGVSIDNGATFTRESNTSTLTADFTEAGRQLVTEFRLSKTDEGPQNATPRFGYNGQEVDSFSTSVNLDDRIVVIDLELSRNHFDNLKNIHETGDFIWSIEHTDNSVATMPVYSFPRGEEVKPYPFEPDQEIDSNPEVAADQYYNTIFVQGRLVNGSRPSAEVEDTEALAEDGREISPGLLRDPDISSDIGATFRARALLNKAQKNGELRGEKTLPATFSIQPGFSYPIVWLGDDPINQTAESVSITKTGDDANTVVDFVNRTGFARDIEELKQNTDNIGDQI